METYYIDFVIGNDNYDGLYTTYSAPNHGPFKHCPGDPNCVDPSVARSCSPTAGDTIYFKGGVTYTGAISIKTSGTSGSRITYDGTPSGWGTGKALVQGYFFFNGKSYITIKNFELTGFAYSAIYSASAGTGNIVDNNTVHDNSTNCRAGIFLDAQTGLIVSNNTVYNLTKTGFGKFDDARGIVVLLGSGNTISGNTIYSTQGTCLWATYSNEVIVTRNIVYGTPIGHSNGISVYNCSNPIISYNYCRTTDQYSYTIEGIDGTGAGARIFNNIGDRRETTSVVGYVFACWGSLEAEQNFGTLYFINNTMVGSWTGSQSYAVMLSPTLGAFPTKICINNIIDGPSSGGTVSLNNCYTDTRTPPSEGGTSVHEPNAVGGNYVNTFVDYVNNDLRLKSTSGCVNAGADPSAYFAVTDDYAGVSRPQPVDGSWDIGAYEYEQAETGSATSSPSSSVSSSPSSSASSSPSSSSSASPSSSASTSPSASESASPSSSASGSPTSSESASPSASPSASESSSPSSSLSPSASESGSPSASPSASESSSPSGSLSSSPSGSASSSPSASPGAAVETFYIGVSNPT